MIKVEGKDKRSRLRGLDGRGIQKHGGAAMDEANN